MPEPDHADRRTEENEQVLQAARDGQRRIGGVYAEGTGPVWWAVLTDRDEWRAGISTDPTDVAADIDAVTHELAPDGWLAVRYAGTYWADGRPRPTSLAAAASGEPNAYKQAAAPLSRRARWHAVRAVPPLSSDPDRAVFPASLVATDGSVNAAGTRAGWAFVTGDGRSASGQLRNGITSGDAVHLAELFAVTAALISASDGAELEMLLDSATVERLLHQMRSTPALTSVRIPVWLPPDLAYMAHEHLNRARRVTVRRIPRNSHPLHAEADRLALKARQANSTRGLAPHLAKSLERVFDRSADDVDRPLVALSHRAAPAGRAEKVAWLLLNGDGSATRATITAALRPTFPATMNSDQRVKGVNRAIGELTRQGWAERKDGLVVIADRAALAAFVTAAVQ